MRDRQYLHHHHQVPDTRLVGSPVEKQAPPLISRISANIQKSVTFLLRTSKTHSAPLKSAPQHVNDSLILIPSSNKIFKRSLNEQNHAHAIIDIASPITSSTHRHSFKQRMLTATSATEVDLLNYRTSVSENNKDCDPFTDDHGSVGHGLGIALIKSFNPGIILLMFQSLFATLSTLLIKTLVSSPYQYNSFNLVLIRSCIIFITGYLWEYRGSLFSNPHSMSSKNSNHLDAVFGPSGVRTLIFFRSFVGFSSSCLSSYALQALTVGEATVISFLSPVFVGILGALILNEKWEKLDAFSSIVSLMGVIIIVNPSILVIDDSPYPQKFDDTPGDFVRLKYITAGILGAFTNALVYISVRQLKNKATAMQVSASLSVHSIYFAFIASWVFYGAPSMAIGRVPTSLTEVAIVLCLSTLGLFNQLSLNIALKFLTAAKASCLNFCQVPFSFMVEYVARGRVPTGSDVIGGCTIVSCVLVVSLAKVWREKVQNIIRSPQNKTVTYDENVTTNIPDHIRNRGVYVRQGSGQNVQTKRQTFGR